MGSPDVVLRSRIFDGLTDGERQRWLGRAARVDVARGQTLARQGDPARHFYLLESGFLKLLQLTADGTELIVRFIAPGDPFGGVVALSDAPYPVTAVAVQPSLALSWARTPSARCWARRRRCASTSCAR
jgi:CRP-like cAMP-binding protein